MNAGPAVSTIRLGVTAYSFSALFHAGAVSFEDLVRRIAVEHLGPGLEVVGFQSFRGFPHLSVEQISRFRDLLAETGLEASCLAVNGDAGLHPGRLLGTAEMVDYMTPQLEAAAQLGFGVARFQKTTSVDAVERLLPLAERLGVRIGYEIHAPDGVRTDWVERLRDLRARTGSPYLGFIPDWGASTHGPHPDLLRAMRSRGVTAEALAELAALWKSEGEVATSGAHEGELIGRFTGHAARLGAGAAALPLAVFLVGIFGHQRPDDWREIGAEIVHVHGKFFGVEDGEEPSIPNRDLLRVLVDAGYRGFVSSEWEGWHWDTTPDAFEKVRAHHDLERAVLASFAVGAR